MFIGDEPGNLRPRGTNRLLPAMRLSADFLMHSPRKRPIMRLGAASAALFLPSGTLYDAGDLRF